MLSGGHEFTHFVDSLTRDIEFDNRNSYHIAPKEVFSYRMSDYMAHDMFPDVELDKNAVAWHKRVLTNVNTQLELIFGDGSVKQAADLKDAWLREDVRNPNLVMR